MKKTLTLLIILASYLAHAQVGMNSQYFPGGQVGFVTIKSSNYPNGKYSKISSGAGFPVLMIDRLASRWYVNYDMSALYYAATQTNKANDNRLKVSKAEGAFCNGRVGYVGGNGDQFRIGGYLGFGWSTSNLDSLVRPFSQKSYINWGLGLIAYKKFGKFRTMGKVGYEVYTKKDYIYRGRGMYFEGTIGYSFYQKYGLSIMPCFYSKGISFYPEVSGSTSTTPADAKVRSFVLKFGLVRFL